MVVKLYDVIVNMNLMTGARKINELMLSCYFFPTKK